MENARSMFARIWLKNTKKKNHQVQFVVTVEKCTAERFRRPTELQVPPPPNQCPCKDPKADS